MAYEVEAFGKIIEVPDDVPKQKAYEQIMANRHKLDPSYVPEKPGIGDKLNKLAAEYLAVDKSTIAKAFTSSPSIADQAEASATEGENTAARQVPGAPVRQSTYNKALLDPTFGIRPTERFRKPNVNGVLDRTRVAANEDIKGRAEQQELELLRTEAMNPTQAQPEGLSGLAGNVLTGAKQTGRMTLATVNAGLDDRVTVESIAKDSAAAAEKNTPVEQRVLLEAIKKIDREQGSFGQIGDTLKAAANNPMGTGQMVVEQLPNTAVSLGAGFAGFKTGGAAGSLFGPVGAAVGGTLGFVGGMFLGNVLLEAGGKAIEKASDEDGFTPQDRDAALREGAIKAAVITGVDAATFKLGSVIFNKLGSEAIKAGARAEAKVLIDAGVDATSLAAINSALKSSPELFKAAKVAGEKASMQALSTGRKTAMLGTGVTLETVGEFAGEAAGEYAATGKADYVDATIEALSSATMSVAETAYNFNKVTSGNDMSPEGIRKAANSINDANTQAGVADIQKAATLDEAVEAASKAVSSKPVTNDDILRTIDPTLADVEALRPTQKETADETQTDAIDTGQAQAAEILDIVLPDNTSVKAQWKIVDADQLAASIKEDVNQPRDRTRAASDVQIKSIANAPDYRRLSDSPVMDVGAPVVDQDGRIVAGNGRFAGLSQAYEQGTATEYMNQLREDAARKGLSIEGVAKPVLVRQLSEPVDTRKMAIASNSGTTLQMSALEQANLDAERMKGIENLDVNDLGDIALTPRNLTQLKDSLGSYAGTELGAMVDKGGQLSQEGMRRVRNAMLAKAYGSSPTLEKLVESTDSDMRNVLGALTKSANHIIKTKGDVKPLMEAVDTYSQLKATGQPVDNFLAQQDAFSDGLSKEAEGILRFIDTNVRSQKKLTDFFKGNFVEVDTTSADMFEAPKAEAPKDERITSLEKHLKDNGYDFTVEPASVRDVDALDSTKKARKELAEKQAKLFKKKVVFVKADGPFKINGVMVPSIADTIFVDIRTDKAFDAIMAHELSHWMEQEKPAVYKELVKSLKTVIINEAEYAKKYGIEGATKAEITKEIVGDLMGDNFTEQSFWQKVAKANPEAFKDIAAAIIRWLKGVIVKAKANGMGSEQWVKDANRAQDIIANAVAQYTENDAVPSKDESKPKFNITGEQVPERLIIDTFNDNTDSTKVDTLQQVENSDNIRAKSIAFQKLAEFEGYRYHRDSVGEKYFWIKRDSDDAQFNIRISDHSNVNRSRHAGEIDINLAIDDGEYPVDTFESALYKMREATVDADGNTLVDGEEIPRFSRAYHGSPHDHNKFESSKIGTGEGAQAYGYGHYFAESKDVAEFYRKNLSNDSRVTSLTNRMELLKVGNDKLWDKYDIEPDALLVDQIGDGAIDAAVEHAEDRLDRWVSLAADETYEFRDYASDKVEAWTNLMPELKAGNVTYAGRGKLYEVELAPEQDEYLLWDKPLSEQSDKVKSALGYAEADVAFKESTPYGPMKDPSWLASNDWKIVMDAPTKFDVYGSDGGFNGSKRTLVEAENHVKTLSGNNTGGTGELLYKDIADNLTGKYVISEQRVSKRGDLEGNTPTIHHVRKYSYGVYDSVRQAKAEFMRKLDSDLRNASDDYAAKHFDQQQRNEGYNKVERIADSKRAASEYLHSLGIRGIKYLDGSSRAKGEGAYNYVIFDDKDVSITAKFSRAPKKLDAEYMDAVNSGDMEKAQQMVDSAAREKGYISGNEYRMMHQAPNRDDYNLATIKDAGIVPDDYWTHPQYYQNDYEERTSFYQVKAAIDSRKQRMFVFRSIPKSVKDDFIRNGDWVSPSRAYAKLEGESIPGGYRIIAQRVDLKDLWWDANSINELGYDDGKEYAHKNTKNNRKLLDAVTYDDDGNAIPLSKRFNSRKSEVKFSKTEIENTLIAQHNLSVRNLIHADRMGGLAAPSIAVTDKAHPLTGFGEITLLSHKDLIDPKNGTKIFGSDIYSPRYPSISYDFSGKPIKALNALLAKGVAATGDSEYYNDNLQNDPFRELTHSSAAMYTFLSEQGVEPELAYTKVKELPIDSLKPFADGTLDSFDMSKDEGFRKLVKDYWAEKFDGEILGNDELSNLARAYSHDVIAYRDSKKNVGKIDRQGTNTKLFRQISDANLRNKFDEYLVDLVNKAEPKERIFKGYTYAGNRQYMPHDIDTVIKILKKDLRGGENFKYGLGSIRAKYSPQFKSIEQIRKSKGMLMNSESFDQVKKEVQAGLDGLNESLASYGTFSGYDNVETMLSDAAKRGISGALKDNGFENVPDSIKVDIQTFLNKLKDMPTEYFEAKILRAVGLGEFSTAVIPDDSTPQVEAILKKNGIEDIRKYKSGDKEDRVKQINKVTHVMFSRVMVDGVERPTTNSEGKPINNPVNFWKWFGDSEARQWSNSSRGDRAMAPPLVLYHGTKGDFNEFVVGSPGTNSTVFGPWETKRAGMFFTQDKKFAESFATQGDSTQGANIIPVYLKVENAIDLTEGFTDDAVIDALTEKGINPRLMYNISADQIWGMFDEEDDGSFFVSKLKELGYDGAIIVEPNTATDESTETWVVFDPNQIKSAIGNNGQFSNTNNDIRFSRAPKLYSKLEQALEAASDKIYSTGPQVKLWLQSNAGKLGIKKDEIYWSGIDNWLDAQGKVSKQQVVEFVRNNGVQVEDVTLGKKAGRTYDEIQEMLEDFNKYPAGSDARRELRVEQSLAEDPEHETKHNNDKLTLPGGTDYKELVVTVPTIEPHNADDSTHFGDTGQGKQIGWLRMDTRDGGLFIEELQSQRAQQGRSKGFFDRSQSPYIMRRKEIQAQIDDVNIQHNMGKIGDITHDMLLDDLKTQLRALPDSDLKLVPPAPFVSDANNKATNAYITLLMKKALIEAVSNDHASVSWTTGDQQADRYDLSKQISEVHYSGTNLKAYDYDGNTVISETGVQEKDLPDYIGKEAAEKLIAQPKNGTLRSLGSIDLKVGGEWAQSMYGNEQGLNLQGKPSLISQAANDIFKHVGSGKVESINGQPGFYVTPEMKSKDLPLFSRVIAQDSEYLDAVKSGDMDTAQRMVNDKLAIVGALWHGTPSGDLRGGMTGLHVGTKRAAMEALEARIGIPADGRGWDGSREYGKTLLAGRDRVASGQFGKYRNSGYNTDSPKNDFYAEDHKLPTVGNDVKVDPSWKPWIRPVLIVGDMAKRKKTDSAANSSMHKLLSKDAATEGFYYNNIAEDAGSVSAVLPNGDYVKVKLPDAVTYDDNGEVIPLSKRFDKANNDIRFSKEPSKPAPPDESRLRRFQRMNQDSFNRFTVIKEWLAENGQTLSDKADVYGAEERYHSMAANQLEDFREQQRNPLIEKIQKAGYTLGDIEVFLKMQHAREANAQIRKLGDNPDATAYGITDDESAEYLAEAPENLAKLANEFRDITEQTKKLRLDAGILNTDITDAWEGAYKHYVPVKGEADSTRGVGKGLKTNFKSKRRLGHSLRDEHVIENILMDHERAILEVERNRVGKHLVMMAAEMQRPDILSIDQPEKRKMLKESTAYTVEANGVVQGVFKSREEAKIFKQFYAASMPKVAPSAIVINQTKDQRVIASASPMLAENEVNVYMNGHAIRVQINDDLLARAYTKMGVEQFSDIVAAGRILNGYLSKVYTGYNPEFILTNMIRDFSSGTINLTGEQGFGMATKALTNYPRMFTDLLKYAVTNSKSSTKWIDAYRKNGGNTGAAYLSDMERLGNEVNTEYASYQGVLSNLKQGDNANAARAAGRKVFNATLKWIYNLNQAGENAMRLAAFKAMIDSGRTVNEAAKVAKNITVNFNRKGERQWAPALYLFYNASVQGTAATAHALTKGKHKGQAWALAGSMAAVGYMVAAVFGGGSEDDYDEINEYTKERNLLIKSGDGYLKIPIPYGYGFFYNLGRFIADAQRTGEWGKLPWHLATSAISEFTPFNEIVVGSDEEFRSDQVFMGLLPTAMKIVAQPTFNKQLFSGSELMPESQFDKSQPDRQKMFRGTKGTMYDTVAGWLDSAGIDVSPETLKYTTRTFTGGAGSLVDTSISAAMLKSEGAELDTQEIPFVRKAYMELSIKDKRAAYYKVREEARTAAEEFNRARRDNDVAKMQDVLKDKKELIALDRYANKLAATIDAARDQQDAVRADKNLSVQEKRLKLKDMEATEAKFYDQYLDVFKTSKPHNKQ